MKTEALLKKKIFVSELAAGDDVQEVFAIAEVTPAKKKDGGSFLKMVLSDRTGSINAVAWDNVDKISAAAASGSFVEVAGKVSEYQKTLQLTVRNLTGCEPARIDVADFLPVSDKDVDAMFRRLLRMTEEMTSVEIKALLNLFWNDDEFVEERFKRAPAAKLMHHAYLGGLIEHTLSVVDLARAVCRHYGDRLNPDLLTAGAMLHDIGKTREFVYALTIDYSNEGRLLNHIVSGIMMVEEKLRQLPEFPEETALLLKHLIASHHGSREFGSPEPPKTLEALVLNHIDEIDAKLVGVHAFMTGHDPGQAWTSFHRPMDRFFYLGGKKEG